MRHYHKLIKATYISHHIASHHITSHHIIFFLSTLSASYPTVQASYAVKERNLIELTKFVGRHPTRYQWDLPRFVLAASPIRVMKAGRAQKSRWCAYSKELFIMTLFRINLCCLFLITLGVSILAFLHQVREP